MDKTGAVEYSKACDCKIVTRVSIQRGKTDGQSFQTRPGGSGTVRVGNYGDHIFSASN